MGKKNENLGDKLRAMSQMNLTPPLKEQTIAELVKEGELLLLQDANKKLAEPPKKKIKTVPYSDNPYLMARHIILDKMDAWNRNEIQRMEESGNTNNRIYQEFIEKISRLGDANSDK